LPGSLQEERPIFIQVAEMLEDAILSGAYGEEEQVPSITEISVAYKMNPATALKGVTLLVDAGLLYKRRGMGMFVARGAREKLLKSRRERFYRDYVLTAVREAKRLQIPPEELVTMTERGYREDGN
jgi:DNA-binding transcriptional regulator YhcF (GntR family)